MTRTASILVVALATLFACGKPPASTPPTEPPAGSGAPSPAVPAATEGDTTEGDAIEGAPEPAAGGDVQPESGEVEGSGTGVAAVADPNAPAEVLDDPAAGLTEPTSMASVKLEIKGEDGKVFKDEPKVIRWDQLTRIPIDFGSRVHEFDLLLGKGGKKAVDIQVSYAVGGKEVLRKYRFDTKPGTREVIQIEGGVAVAITVTPKTVEPKPIAERDKVETPDSRDPLAGAK